MKNIIVILVFILAASSPNAQILYGTTTSGGDNDGGVICKLDVASKILTPEFSFDGKDFSNPSKSNLIQAIDGKLYGMASTGGSGSYGGIFSYDPATSVYTRLKDFGYTGDNSPSGSLLQASDGKLYGMTQYGGSGYSGVIFSYDPVTLAYTKVKEFDGTDGSYPQGSLIQGADGKLYGMTQYGGTFYGVIFSFDPATLAFTKLKDFDNVNGAYPTGSLVQGANGKLYGMTSKGGANGYGVIFSFDPATLTYIKLNDFDNTNGANPLGSLVQAANGKLYGLTSQGGSNNYGTMFSYNPANSIYTKLKNFNFTDGAHPYGSLIQASDGKLYGLTSEGGNFNGVIFSYNPATSTYTKLKDFDNINGAYPRADLMQAADGKLYGMTVAGGNGNGIIFSFEAASQTLNNLRNFGSNNTGFYLKTGLAKGNSNNLYGITFQGGNYGYGVIFSYDPGTSAYKKLKDFNYADGTFPEGLIQASNGKLYGITNRGGSNDRGVIFSYDPANSIYKKLKDFNYPGGISPNSLIQSSDGKLYGTTTEGGNYGFGIIFSYDPVTSGYKKMLDFDSSAWSYGNKSLVEASDGKLYGTTEVGAANGGGAIFSFDPLTLAFIKLKDFDNVNGSYSQGNLIQTLDGNLYGMTHYGGINDYGVIFSFNPTTLVYDRLKDFKKKDGTYPKGSLMQGSDGKLYGMTSEGGSKGLGVSFSYDPVTSVYTKLADFTGTNGSMPANTFFIEMGCEIRTYYRDADGDGYGDITISTKTCLKPEGYVTDNTDCNDNNASVHPGTVEICGNGIDDNCNGKIDENCIEAQISIADKSITEGDSGNKFMYFIVRLDKKAVGLIKVKYATQNGTAKAGSDYIAKSGTVLFAPGTSQSALFVKIKGDETIEANEEFNITLSDPENAILLDSIATGIILNDDYNKDVAQAAANKEVASVTHAVSLAPNPAQYIVTVTLSGYSGNVTIQLTGIEGKVLEQRKIQAFAKQIQQQINISHYAHDIYFITIIDEKGNRKTEKLVIAK